MNVEEKRRRVQALFGDLEEELLEPLVVACGEATFESGEKFIQKGERGDIMYLLTAGRAQVRLPLADGDHQVLTTLEEGDTIGEIALVAGGERTADAVAVEALHAITLDDEAFENLVAELPELGRRFAALAARRVRALLINRAFAKLFGEIDRAVLDEMLAAREEITLQRGETLFRQGDLGDAWYVLTSGRLEVIVEDERGAKRKVNEIRCGGTVGEIALLADTPRSASIVAKRASTLARFSVEAYERFAKRHTSFGQDIARMVVKSVISGDPTEGHERSPRVLAVILQDDSLEVSRAATVLEEAFGRVEDTKVLNQASFERSLARSIDPDSPPDHPVWTRFHLWAEESESSYPCVVIDGGSASDGWADISMTRSDRVVLVVRADIDDDDIERINEHRDHVAQMGKRLPTSLVIVHPEGTEEPSGTARLLDAFRPRSHHHVALDRPESFARSARLIRGHGVAVALGGGGARGFAHMGVLKAFEEENLAIDLLTGTSIGAIQAAFYARGLSIDKMIELNVEARKMKPFEDYTIPMLAVLKSRRRDAAMEYSVGEALIEDLWRPCRIVTTDLQSASMVVHDRGPLYKAAAASSSLPGVLVPIIDGERMLVDGGVINNLPVDLAKDAAGGLVVGVNVSPESALPMPEVAFPSGWSIFWRRMLPWKEPHAVPTLGGILSRTLMVASVDHSRRMAKEADFFLDLPIEKFGMLAFDQLDELLEVGYEHAKTIVPEMRGRWPKRLS
jgi:NTE family protein/lysophospholipid hydrolase